MDSVDPICKDENHSSDLKRGPGPGEIFSLDIWMRQLQVWHSVPRAPKSGRKKIWEVPKTTPAGRRNDTAVHRIQVPCSTLGDEDEKTSSPAHTCHICLGVLVLTWPASIRSFFCRRSTRSSSREVRIRVPFSVVYFSRGTLPIKKETIKGHLAGGPSQHQHLLDANHGAHAWLQGLDLAATRWPYGGLHGCGSKIGTQNGTLVHGNNSILKQASKQGTEPW